MRFYWLLLLFTLSACTPEGPRPKPFPEIALRRGVQSANVKFKDLDGNKLKLSSLRGEVLLVNFWATWCVTCSAEMQALQNLHDQLHSQGFSVVAISIDDDKKALLRFAKERKLHLPIYHDAFGEARRAFGAYSLPITFLLDRKGRFVYFSEHSSAKESLSLTGPRNWDDPDTVTRILQFIQNM